MKITEKFAELKPEGDRSMTLEQIKSGMKEYRDFYGGDLLESEDIDKATTKEELREIIEHHRDYMCLMLSDAYGHLDRFTERMKLRDIDL